MKKWGMEWITVLLFLGILAVLSIGSILAPKKGFSEHENRFLEKLPSFSLQAALEGELEKKYEAYLTDHFIFRDRWIGMKTAFERLMGKTEQNGVYFAKNGYLIESGKKAASDSSIKEKNKRALKKNVDRFRELLGKERVQVLIAPTASEVLSDALPPFAAPVSQREFLDEIKEMLSGENFIEVLEPLLQQKEEYLYYRTDHHWTTLGAYYAYAAYAQQTGLLVRPPSAFKQQPVSDDFYGTLYSKVHTKSRPDQIVLYEEKEPAACQVVFNEGEKESSSLYQMEMLKKKDQYAVFFGGNYGAVEITTGQENGRHLFVIKDSYANCFVPFLIRDFEKITMIDLRYFHTDPVAYARQKGATDMLLLYNALNLMENSDIR